MSTAVGHPMAWADRAACVGMETERFYVERGPGPKRNADGLSADAARTKATASTTRVGMVITELMLMAAEAEAYQREAARRGVLAL